MESHSTETFLSSLPLESLATILPLRATVPLDQNPSFKALNAISKNLAAASLDSKLKCSRKSSSQKAIIYFSDLIPNKFQISHNRKICGYGKLLPQILLLEISSEKKIFECSFRAEPVGLLSSLDGA